MIPNIEKARGLLKEYDKVTSICYTVKLCLVL